MRHRKTIVAPVTLARPARGDMWVDRDSGIKVEVLRAGETVRYWYPLGIACEVPIEDFVGEFTRSDTGWWLP